LANTNGQGEGMAAANPILAPKLKSIDAADFCSYYVLTNQVRLQG